ncbi:hypothetical protein SERLA73DRAFT_86729 [Serpula lacrymans var. lacrymans S7.3]|uniref:Aminotransferase class V domain-containing protein n=2 Tax=Serpula lacrymans var. lacrymans TaxID=341189 RepID=F8PTJ8_SERL3|nr:uncharacterized protein SERLADRAFT_462770 [Serpula lacrymans var. lacrymans S7.9]EGO00526.1 hypothetical protein SERLA73DRAFT_86729 [Serpula lacrymans var. lacrymans S7.3]EGO26085.1 hypothetical protein SERLADRAFT_462770 [Serpula lacrymans var. lacrymans S7.9]
MASLDIDQVRSSFPALKSGYLFGDNAGGSQTLQSVIDRITDYLSNTNVQLGADYLVSVQSTQRVADGAVAAAQLFNAASSDEVAMGPSSTMLFENLARALENEIQAGDELIITGEHEANNGGWKRLAVRRGAIVKVWHATPTDPNNPYSVSLKVEELLPLISNKTRVIAFTACSNILGSVVPVEEIVKAARQHAKEQGVKKLEISVDCVAYGPHRRIDVQKWDIDYCVFAFYKLYGAHHSALYVRSPALKFSLTSLAHHFLQVDDKPYKVQPGGPGYELVYSATAVPAYLLSLTPANDLQASFDAIARHEQTLIKPLITFLTDPKQEAQGVRIVGQSKIDLSRVPTVSFVVVGPKSVKSKDIVAVFDKRGGIGIRYGHFYAYTLVSGLEPKLDAGDGVVRISFVHYNTVEEVEKVVEILEEILA